MSDQERLTIETEGGIEVRSASRREIEMRLLPWDTVIETRMGPETFSRGSIADAADDGLYLYGLEHEAHFGIDQRGEPIMTRHAVGRSTRVWEADDGPRAVFKVARTAGGDDVLALAEDGIYRGVSAEFSIVPGGTTYEKRGGRKVRVHNRVNLTGASLVRRPAYGEMAAVVAVRSEQEETAVSETTEAAEVQTTAPAVDLTPITTRMEDAFIRFDGRFKDLEDRLRQDIDVPSQARTEADGPTVGQWVKTALRALTGERISDTEMRAWSDLVTTDNLGVVPESFSREILGIIDTSRPFLGSTRRIPTPESGMTLNLPVLTTRPTTGVQVNEKDEITSTPTDIGSTGFDALTIAGGGDISVQLLKRSDPSYLTLFLELLAEALSETAEAEAIAALLAAGVTPGTGTIDPEALVIGEAWTNARAARQRADTMWMSSDAVAEFIDAKVDGTNAPLYSNLAADITVGGGPGGRISGLRPVHVPALDGSGSDVVIGPSRGFAWAEDGAFTLQVDVPRLAGRDVALVSIMWFAPLYAAAFTEWSL
jgi:HK97 family phage major capsid protein